MANTETTPGTSSGSTRAAYNALLPISMPAAKDNTTAKAVPPALSTCPEHTPAGAVHPLPLTLPESNAGNISMDSDVDDQSITQFNVTSDSLLDEKDEETDMCMDMSIKMINHTVEATSSICILF